MSVWGMDRVSWFLLPLKLRQRWWRETDYGRLEPSVELVRAIWQALGVIKPGR
jgi:hypothetical protein